MEPQKVVSYRVQYPLRPIVDEKKALDGGPFWRSVNKTGLTAFVGTLAGVLLAACCHTAFQADALATTAGWQGETRLGSGTGRCFAVSFGNDFVAHVNFQEKK